MVWDGNNKKFSFDDPFTTINVIKSIELKKTDTAVLQRTQLRK